MKKLLAVLSIIIVLALMSAACTHHTCPAYRGSVAENVE